VSCTAAAVLAVLHATELPPRGTVIIVPAAIVARYSDYEQRAIRNCARRFGIDLRKGHRQGLLLHHVAAVLGRAGLDRARWLIAPGPG
jgi:hypothetical protein